MLGFGAAFGMISPMGVGGFLPGSSLSANTVVTKSDNMTSTMMSDNDSLVLFISSSLALIQLSPDKPPAHHDRQVDTMLQYQIRTIADHAAAMSIRLCL